MPGKIIYTIDDIQLKKTLRTAPGVIDRARRRALTKSARHLQREIRKRTPEDTGALVGSINWFPAKIDDRYTLSSTQKYAPSIEFGSAPHYIAYDDINQWARRKGINPYAVIHSIAQKGTKGKRPFGKTFEAEKGEVVKIIKKISAELRPA